MEANRKCLLTVNGGSSSIKFALFEAQVPIRRTLSGKIEGIGQNAGAFVLKEPDKETRRPIQATDHRAAVAILMDWVQDRIQSDALAAVGHRVVHGGAKFIESQLITPELVRELHNLSPLDPEHLPEEILLTECFHERFPTLPQVACFDTAFHRDMPRVAKLLPIPRRFEAAGVRRYGFHGLSCAYLVEELERVEPLHDKHARVVLAHLGNGASLTAVRNGKSVDTSMGFTPAAGIPMSTRSGDLDPGVAWYLGQTERISPREFHEMINHQSGLLGVSETSSDIRDLLAREKVDVRAAEALALFCYQAKKWVCALAGALEGLDTLVFSGGIGENSFEIRERICRNLEFLGIDFDNEKNCEQAAVISRPGSRVTVRVIRTDEEHMMAKEVCQVLNLGPLPTQKAS